VSYVVSIRRTKENPIQLNEFEKAVSDDPEFTKATEIQDQNSPSYIWIQHNSIKETYFHYWQPDISIESPSEQAFEKIQQLASKLDASVIGEEGEALSSACSIKKPADDNSSLQSFINGMIVILVLYGLIKLL
jgi:hypothetical protein